MNDAAAPRHPVLVEIDRHWLRWTVLVWLATMAFYLIYRAGAIHWLALTDTDDNMRLMQVRALLDGQGWFDLRQYRLNPPAGFDIHWSRIVDLPIAGLILFFRLFTDNAHAERLACGIAPIIPLGVAMGGLAFTVRRLVSPLAWPLAIVLLLAGGTATTLMFMPMRIDHHGWQLAMLSLTVAGLADERRARGGLIVGLSSSVSIAIGLEMLPYCAMAGAILTLRWVWDRNEARRLAVYGATLAGGIAAGFAGFASIADRVMRCDALTPVYLVTLTISGTLLLVLAVINPQARWARLALAVVAGVIVAAGFAWLFPQCLGRPEQVSPELAQSWLDNVKEARPIFRHPVRLAVPIAAMPIVGVIGAWLATWQAWRQGRGDVWVPVALFVSFAAAMLLWQIRAGPAAQLLAVPGAAALGWIVLPWCLNHGSVLVRTLGTVAVFLILSGSLAELVIEQFHLDPPSKQTKIVNKASANCPTIPAMAPLDRYPAQTVFTFVDLGPRLITLTHHDAVAGPYHRNGGAILDVQHAFQGSPDQFRAIAQRHGATLLLVCPNMAESTVYRARSPDGFYGRLARNEVPAWLTPLPLPKGSPFRLWKIR